MFADAARPLGCAEIQDSRSVAIADLDNDGRLDMVVANNADPPTIHMNRIRSAGNYLRVVLTGARDKNRDAIGGRVRVTIEHNEQRRTLSRWVEVGSGYCSQSDTRLHFGLGQAEKVTALEVTWPDGQKQTFQEEALQDIVNRELRIQQGVDRLERSSATVLNTARKE